MQDSPPMRPPLDELRPLATQDLLARASVGSNDATHPRPTLEDALREQRPVLCAVDGDDLAGAVLATAAVLAAQLAVPLTVIHSADADALLFGEPRQAALDRGHAFVDELVHAYAIDERVVDLGEPARLITAVAADGASLIVVGTRRRTGLRAALLGSVSREVIARATCPVLTVPASAMKQHSDVGARGHPGAGGRRAPGSHGPGHAALRARTPQRGPLPLEIIGSIGGTTRTGHGHGRTLS
jgi:nucleotide-binding universal stress UspA family protein